MQNEGVIGFRMAFWPTAHFKPFFPFSSLMALLVGFEQSLIYDMTEALWSKTAALTFPASGVRFDGLNYSTWKERNTPLFSRTQDAGQPEGSEWPECTALTCNLTRLSASDILAMFYLAFRCWQVQDGVFCALTGDVDRGDESSQYGQSLGRAARE